MKRSNKRALLTSVLALVMCVAMLVGTTFAWFTDSVQSGMNNIVAGNLDIELEYSKDASSWNTVSSATDLFSGALWEPGHTEVVYLRLKNLGTLALNYQLGIHIVSETEGTNAAGDTFKLSDYIRFGVVEGQSTEFADRAAAVAAVTDSKKLNEGYSKASSMVPGAADAYMALVVYMPENVGNEANYRGTAVPAIQLGINVLATQMAHESDSFDNLYDAEVGEEEQPGTPEDLPVANVTRSAQYENVELNWGSYGVWSPTEGLDSQLEAAYTFQCADIEGAKNSPYADWHCDFYVKLDRDLGVNQIFLGGNYGNYGWVGFHNGNMTLPANTEIGLLSSVTSNPWTYQAVAENVGTFICGVGDVNNALAGATFTVMLRLTNPEDATEFYNVAVITYTFE